MNQEHYEKVRRVLALSEVIKAEVAKKADPSKAAMPVADQCRLLWKAEFPEGFGDPPGVRLDLSAADFTGGLFAGAFDHNPMDGADLRGARLDGTRWLFFGMAGADLSGASLRESKMLCLMCEGSRFRGADLSGASISLLGSKPVDFTNANLTGAAIDYVLGNGYPQALVDGAVVDNLRVLRPKAQPLVAPEAIQSALDEFLGRFSEEQRAKITVVDDVPASQRGKEGNAGKGCFVATACYGSSASPEVLELRRFRDEVLLPSRLGRRCVATYYRVSPPVARLISRSTLLKAVARIAIVGPVVILIRKRHAVRRG